MFWLPIPRATCTAATDADGKTPMSEVAVWYGLEHKPKGKKTYTHTEKNSQFHISRYVFDVYGDTLHIKAFQFNGRKQGDLIIEHFLSVPAYKMMEIIGKGNLVDVLKNAPLYDGLLRTYKENGGNVGLTIPITRA